MLPPPPAELPAGLVPCILPLPPPSSPCSDLDRDPPPPRTTLACSAKGCSVLKAGPAMPPSEPAAPTFASLPAAASTPQSTSSASAAVVLASAALAFRRADLAIGGRARHLPSSVTTAATEPLPVVPPAAASLPLHPAPVPDREKIVCVTASAPSDLLLDATSTLHDACAGVKTTMPSSCAAALTAPVGADSGEARRTDDWCNDEKTPEKLGSPLPGPSSASACNDLSAAAAY
nr:wiskott-Aldrich syndrome protein homolog 1-like [Aegilops tauschii subsp. strangulata]